MLLERAFDVALGCALCHILALVIELFTSAQPDLQLDAAVFEIQAYRDERIARLLYHAVEAVDLFFMHKESAHAHGIAVEDISLLIGGNVHTVHKNFALDYGTPAVLEVYPALTDRFDLGSEQLDARLIALLDKIIVVRLFVLRDRFQ